MSRKRIELSENLGDGMRVQAAVPGWRSATPILSSVCFTGRCDCSTSRMISSFPDAGHLIRGRPHLRQAQRRRGRDHAARLMMAARISTSSPRLTGYDKLKILPSRFISSQAASGMLAGDTHARGERFNPGTARQDAYLKMSCVRGKAPTLRLQVRHGAVAERQSLPPGRQGCLARPGSGAGQGIIQQFIDHGGGGVVADVELLDRRQFDNVAADDGACLRREPQY
jgi:hypothetical protein